MFPTASPLPTVDQATEQAVEAHLSVADLGMSLTSTLLQAARQPAHAPAASSQPLCLPTSRTFDFSIFDPNNTNEPSNNVNDDDHASDDASAIKEEEISLPDGSSNFTNNAGSTTVLENAAVTAALSRIIGIHHPTTAPPSTEPTETFPGRIRRMIEGTEKAGLQDIICLPPSEEGMTDTFYIFHIHAFAKTVLPQYFPDLPDMESFQRRLDIFCYLQVDQGKDWVAYSHPVFLRPQAIQKPQGVALLDMLAPPSQASFLLATPRKTGSLLAPTLGLGSNRDNTTLYHL